MTETVARLKLAIDMIDKNNVDVCKYVEDSRKQHDKIMKMRKECLSVISDLKREVGELIAKYDDAN